MVSFLSEFNMNRKNKTSAKAVYVTWGDIIDRGGWWNPYPDNPPPPPTYCYYCDGSAGWASDDQLVLGSPRFRCRGPSSGVYGGGMCEYDDSYTVYEYRGGY